MKASFYFIKTATWFDAPPVGLRFNKESSPRRGPSRGGQERRKPLCPRLKLARYPTQLAATLATLPSISEIQFLLIPDSEYLFVSTGASGFDSRNVDANNEAKNVWIEWTHH